MLNLSYNYFFFVTGIATLKEQSTTLVLVSVFSSCLSAIKSDS